MISGKLLDPFFNERGLVSQQLDSYNLFIRRSIQGHVKEHPAITLIPQDQSIPNITPTMETRYTLKFDNCYIDPPRISNQFQERKPMFPNDARLRNLTYSADMYIDIIKEEKKT